MSEAQFQRQVIDLARHCGWRVAHFRPARRGNGGWCTPMQGNPGWPDCVFCHPARGLFLVRELKTDQGRPTPEQVAWLAALEAAGVDAKIWRPSDLDEIVATLTGAQQ